MVAGGWGRDSQGVWEDHGHTAVFKTDNHQGPIVQHMKLYSTLCASLDGREIWERMDRCICMAETLCCLSETTITLLIGYTPMQNKKFKVWKKKRFNQKIQVSKSWGRNKHNGIGKLKIKRWARQTMQTLIQRELEWLH